MKIVRYTSDRVNEWDRFIEGSRNGTFLFLRAYMDYHSDRFHDHSLMYFSDKGKLLAVMAANEKDGVLYSHQGLTYGGFIIAQNVHTLDISECFEMTKDYLLKQGFQTWIYKQMPTIYHNLPAEDDEYWLWKNNAELIGCSLMSAIPLRTECALVSSSKRNNSNRLRRLGYTVEYDAPISEFWSILTQNLHVRFKATPVHTLDELSLLKQRFLRNIICCTVKSPDNEVVGGTVLYLANSVVKAQYTSASPEGKRVKALDMLILDVLEHYRKAGKYSFFDFGTSMLTDSTLLNEGLVLQKEGFGGRGVACRTYKIKVGSINYHRK